MESATGTSMPSVRARKAPPRGDEERLRGIQHHRGGDEQAHEAQQLFEIRRDALQSPGVERHGIGHRPASCRGPPPRGA